MKDKIEPGEFASIASNKKLKGSGLSLGEEVLVVSTAHAPEKHNDPYLFRMYVHAAKLAEDSTPLFPNNNDEEDNGNRLFLIDPRNLTKVSEDRQKELMGKLEKKYGNSS